MKVTSQIVSQTVTVADFLSLDLVALVYNLFFSPFFFRELGSLFIVCSTRVRFFPQSTCAQLKGVQAALSVSMASLPPSRVVRRLYEPSALPCVATLGTRSETEDEVAVHSSSSGKRGFASRDECNLLVSSSFHPLLEKALSMPAPVLDVQARFGGTWFWEVYRHALFGENLVVHLRGSGVVLTEDTLDSQLKLRSQLCCSEASRRRDALLRHGTAKLEVLLSISLSVALHVASQPLLEVGLGPQAVVLCATKEQCDEVSYLLNQFCGALHLVLHNLFEPYPTLPDGKRADVVVGTPPLWISVSQVGKGSTTVSVNAKHLGGLEDLLMEIEGEGQLPPAYDLTRWRPYSIGNVSQLVLLDIGLQVNMGFAPIILHLLGSDPTTGLAGFPVGQSGRSIPRHSSISASCQLYAVVGGDRFVMDDAAERAVLRLIQDYGRRKSNFGTASIGLVKVTSESRFVAASPSQAESLPSVGTDDRAVKRGRIESQGSGVNVSPASGVSGAGDESTGVFCGLLIRNALSHARLASDFSAYTDFVSRIIQEASQFWSSFEGSDEGEDTAGSCELDPHDRAYTPPSSPPAPVLRFVAIDLSLLCTTVDYEGSMPNRSQPSYCVEEVCVWVHPSPRATVELSSRLRLLFQHLEDVLCGEVFDGSVVYCIHADDIRSLPYDIEPLHLTQEEAARKVLLYEMFQYTDAVQLALLCRLPRPHILHREAQCVCSALRTAVVEELVLPPLLPMEVPPFYFLLSPPIPTPPAGAFTVLVVRNLARTLEQLCGGPCTATTAGWSCAATPEKPLALYFLEECCQYGRVLSYYIYEQPFDGESEDGVHVRTSTASIFIEFSSSDAAAEAVRMISCRFLEQQREMHLTEGTSPTRLPRARLFKNTTYYEGVSQELCMKKNSGEGAGSSDCIDLFDDLLDVSLLAE